MGWLLGAVELSAITFHGALQSAAARLIPALFQVHGRSQIVGWVGLFIMGISYQVIPRQRRVAIHTPVLAYVVLFAWNLWRTLATSATETAAASARPVMRVAAIPVGPGASRAQRLNT